ncbi:MAG: hypothetical protein RQ866_07575 [Bacteroidales bacterium]|nr:hypothetical protein [Bacteroidales bacterium]
MKNTLIIMLIVFFWVPSIKAQTKEDTLYSPEKHYTIQLTHLAKGKTKILTEGNNIKVLDKSGRKVKGRITSIEEDYFVICNDTFSLDTVDYIRKPLLGTRIVGCALFGSGVGITGLGTVFIIEGLSNATMAGVILVVMGIPLAGVGLLATAVGGVFLLIGKKYNIDKKYAISIVSEE